MRPRFDARYHAQRPADRSACSENPGNAREGQLVAFGLVAMLVQKFGGTSVADAERMRNVADYIARAKRRGDQPVIVVSAMGHETDDLLDCGGEGVQDLARPGDGHAHYCG